MAPSTILAAVPEQYRLSFLCLSVCPELERIALVEASKKTGVIVWSSIAAAAAGVIAVAVIVRLRERKKSVVSNLRDVRDVLADCYQKIREIEDQLPGSKSSQDRIERVSTNILANGNTVMDS